MRTIWHPDAMPLVPQRFRSLYTVLLPAIDVGLILFGITSLTVGSKIIGDFTLPWFRIVWGAVILGGALVALFGLITVHKRSELVGRFAVGLGLLVYVTAIIFYIVDGSGSSLLTLVLVIIRLAALSWRIDDLLTDIGREEADREARTGGKHAQ